MGKLRESIPIAELSYRKIFWRRFYGEYFGATFEANLPASALRQIFRHRLYGKSVSAACKANLSALSLKQIFHHPL